MPVSGQWQNKRFLVNPDSIYKMDNFSMGSTSSEEDGAHVRSPKTISLDIPLSIHAGVNLIDEFNDWDDRINQSAYFYLGTRNLGVQYRLSSVNLKDTIIDDYGNMRSGTITVEFEQLSTNEGRKISYITYELTVNALVKIVGTKFADGKTVIPNKYKRRVFRVRKITANKVFLKGISKSIFKKDVTLV